MERCPRAARAPGSINRRRRWGQVAYLASSRRVPASGVRPRSTTACCCDGATLAGRRDRLHQNAHLFGVALPDFAPGHGHHHRDGQPDAGVHLGDAADEVLLKAGVAFDAILDALQGAAASVAALPARSAVRHRDEDAPVMLVELDAPLAAWAHPGGLVAFGLAFDYSPEASRRTSTPTPTHARTALRCRRAR